MTAYDFAISGQHYLFDVQSFAHTVLAAGGDAYSYGLLDRTTQGVIDDVVSGTSELGVIMQTSATADALNAALAEAGLTFHELAVSAPLVALPASHPLVNAKSLAIEQLADYPYVYFDQGEDAPIAFYEEALAEVPRAKKVACTDRASLTELIMAINGYTITSGILVGITDGSALTTIPLKTNIQLHLGYVTADNRELTVMGERFVSHLKRSLDYYAQA
ncbi:LysR substrate-binding domain-containing protein [uncultured Adlercreutzia sp.]|uniref:LysR substrate-binding domain-containing protein n=1 Tax=uncultured Adlercreutzia sp. TaxID=875803 RepID=UPI0026F3EAEE|nr:LysR substrate-binding domain-containing protein [uncultured Adlercreutzia sp.]